MHKLGACCVISNCIWLTDKSSLVKVLPSFPASVLFGPVKGVGGDGMMVKTFGIFQLSCKRTSCSKTPSHDTQLNLCTIFYIQQTELEYLYANIAI